MSLRSFAGFLQGLSKGFAGLSGVSYWQPWFCRSRGNSSTLHGLLTLSPHPGSHNPPNPLNPNLIPKTRTLNPKPLSEPASAFSLASLRTSRPLLNVSQTWKARGLRKRFDSEGRIHTLHTYMHACMHACIHTYLRAYVHTYIRTYIHRYIHTYIHIYIYIYIYYIYMSMFSKGY